MRGIANKLDLRQLRQFLAVAQTGSFSVAAESLGLSQSAISKGIRALEQQLGVQLLDRGPNGAQVTLFGQNLLSYCQLILSLADEAVEEMDALRGARRGALRIGGLPAALLDLVPDATLRFAEQWPEIALLFHEGLNEFLLPMLYNGRIDILFSTKPTEPVNDDFEWRLVRTEPVQIICAEHHPLAKAANITLDELSAYSWVMPPRPEPDRQTIDTLFRSSGFPRPKIVMETTSISFLRSIIRKTSYLSYLTRPGIQEQGSGITPLNIPELKLSRELYAAFRRRGVVRPTVISFLRELR